MDIDVLCVLGAKLESRSRGTRHGFYKQITGNEYTSNSEAEGGIGIVCHYYLYIFGYICEKRLFGVLLTSLHIFFVFRLSVPSNGNDNYECAQLLMSDVVMT
jgi:hypothetical protein